MKGDAGALDEPLDIYFTFSLCGKSERETEGEEISPRSYFPHSGELQAAQLHYTCTEQSAWRRFTKTTKYLVTDCLTCSVEDERRRAEKWPTGSSAGSTRHKLRTHRHAVRDRK